MTQILTARSERLPPEKNYRCEMTDRRRVDARNCQRDNADGWHRAVYQLEYVDADGVVHRARYCQNTAAAVAARFHIPFPPGPRKDAQ